jgi:hypothetical protein
MCYVSDQVMHRLRANVKLSSGFPARPVRTMRAGRPTKAFGNDLVLFLVIPACPVRTMKAGRPIESLGNDGDLTF